MRKSFYLFLFIFCLAVSGFSQSSAQTFTTNEGDRFQIELKAEKEEVMVGEPTLLWLTVKNLSKQTLTTNITSAVIDGENVQAARLTVIDSGGNPVRRKSGDWLRGYDLVNRKTTLPNSSESRRILLGDWADIKNSGAYTINLYLTISAGRSSTLTSIILQAILSVKITVTPTDDAKMGELIDWFGTALLSQNRSAQATSPLFMLDQINDERVIPYLIKALKSRFDENAAKALVKFDNYEALQALEDVMNPETRFDRKKIAQVLSGSQNPEAWEILVKFRNDGDYSIRERAVEAMEKLDTEESTIMLREMLNDKIDFIAKKAQEILEKRRQK